MGNTITIGIFYLVDLPTDLDSLHPSSALIYTLLLMKNL